jgi:hypothetical protein
MGQPGSGSSYDGPLGSRPKPMRPGLAAEPISGHPPPPVKCARRIVGRLRPANGGPNADDSPRGRIGFAETVALLFLREPVS